MVRAIVAVASPKVTFTSTLGAILIGSFISTILYGILCLQCYVFFRRFNRDNRTIKYSIWILWLLNTLHVICSIHECYTYLVTNFLNLTVLAEVGPWSKSILIMVSATCNGIVQSWFTWRIFVLSTRNRLLVTLLSLAVVATWAIGFGFSIAALRAQTPVQFAALNWFIYLTNSVDAATNLVLTITLLFMLAKLHQSPIKQTQSLINTLMAYTVNTGLLSFIMILSVVIMSAIRQGDLVFFSVYVPYSPIYSNALLGSLNARDWFPVENTVSSPLPPGGSFSIPSFVVGDSPTDD